MFSFKKSWFLDLLDNLVAPLVQRRATVLNTNDKDQIFERSHSTREHDV